MIRDLNEAVVTAERLFDTGQLDQALALASEVLAVAPTVARAHQVVGCVLSKLRPAEALAPLRRALELHPGLVPSLNHLGISLNTLGEPEEALPWFEAALGITPANPNAHFNRAMAWLKTGRFREGWLEYEWRWLTGQVNRPEVPRPLWDGSPLAGKTLFVHTEQGVGDTIQFVRFLPHIRRQGARVVFCCQKGISQLLRSCVEVDEWFPVDEPGPLNFDLQASMMSLPRLLGVNAEEDIPAPVGYLKADPGRVERWRQRLESRPGLRVGICWQGSPTHLADRFRSFPLKTLAPLGAIPGVRLVSLQKGPGREQLAGAGFPVEELPGLDEEGPFLDTAAVMQNLAVVVTADTAVAHLAGALGRPVWVLLSVGSDWRYLHGRDDSPWYPTMRLFRQERLGDWSGPVAAVAQALAAPFRPEQGLEPRESRGTRPRVISGVEGVLPRIPVAPGELLDKITILQIKRERFTDEGRKANVLRELAVLEEALEAQVALTDEVRALAAELKTVNEQLWELEDDLRVCEQAGDFGERFVGLARSVYQTNDRRSALKRKINELLGSALIEEKSYGARPG